VPMTVVELGANRHDIKPLAETLEVVVLDRPEPTDEAPQHLCADEGDDYDKGREEAAR
jgi:hypothetical protein